MKKEYIQPTSTAYEVRAVAMMALSTDDGGEGLGNDDFGPGGDYEIDAREDNTGRDGNSVWDNVW